MEKEISLMISVNQIDNLHEVQGFEPISSYYPKEPALPIECGRLKTKSFIFKFYAYPLQPERSKREDSDICDEARKEMRKFLDETFNERIDYCHQQRIEEMRCSELYGNIERPAEKIWPA